MGEVPPCTRASPTASRPSSSTALPPAPRSASSPPPTASTLSGREDPPSHLSPPSHPAGSARRTSRSTVPRSSTESVHERCVVRFSFFWHKIFLAKKKKKKKKKK